MAVISTEKGWGAKNLIFKPFPFHSTDFYPSSQVYQELCSLPDLTLTSAASSQLRGWLKPKPHTLVSCWGTCIQQQCWLWALPNPPPRASLHKAPGLQLPQASWSHRGLGFTGYRWLGPASGLQAGQPWILLSKRTNPFLNVSLLFLLWFQVYNLFPL